MKHAWINVIAHNNPKCVCFLARISAFNPIPIGRIGLFLSNKDKGGGVFSTYHNDFSLRASMIHVINIVANPIFINLNSSTLR